MSSKLKRVKHNGGVEGLAERVKTPGTVDVGIIDAGKHTDSEETVASIGFKHEFGFGNIPERSFMRSTIREKRQEISSLQKKLLKKIQSGDTELAQALGLLGEHVSGAIKQKIIAIKSPPNSAATIAKKGSSNPLIDTGQLKNSITYEVHK